MIAIFFHRCEIHTNHRFRTTEEPEAGKRRLCILRTFEQWWDGGVALWMTGVRLVFFHRCEIHTNIDLALQKSRKLAKGVCVSYALLSNGGTGVLRSGMTGVRLAFFHRCETHEHRSRTTEEPEAGKRRLCILRTFEQMVGRGCCALDDRRSFYMIAIFFHRCEIHTNIDFALQKSRKLAKGVCVSYALLSNGGTGVLRSG